MKMSSRDDETLLLSGFSEGFSVDVTVDEDFIPTSQPQSHFSSKVTRAIESNAFESFEKVNTQPLSGFVDDTLPPEALIEETQEKSVDFIPDTETKKRNIYFSKAVACRKKLSVFGTEKIFNLLLEQDKVLENSTLKKQTNFVFCTSPVKMESSSVKVGEGSITEILVNDSADTVELGESPVKVARLKGLESPDRDEETQMFDNSVCMLDQPGPSGLNEVNSQKLYLNETVDDELQLQNNSNSNNNNNLEVSRGLGQILETGKPNQESLLKEEPPSDTASQDGDDASPSVVVKKRIDFKLNVSCLLIINTAAKKVIRKEILNVDERPKPKTPPFYSELLTDCGSDKSKRCSTSSSGSVYSDQNGLPFALPKRISAVFDQTWTCGSDSSEENLGKFVKTEIRNHERVPWNNESLLALKMDEIIKGMMDSQELINRPCTRSPKKSKRSVRQSDLNRLEHISENSSSDRTQKSETDLSQYKKVLGGSSDAAKCNTPPSLPEEVKLQEEPAQSIQNKCDDVTEKGVPEVAQKKQISCEPEKPCETEAFSLCDGLRVFARWTDKQYYSGVLSEQSKNEKWNVLFDDGTLKAIKEDFIMPAAWLKVGSLVFALVDDAYESGQVTDVKKDENTTYVVQLDNGKQEVTIGLSDMRLSDDMAAILRENYRPLGVESPQRKADINCDNVLSGKRLRECRTPLRPPPLARIENSLSKKKPISKMKDLECLRETPKKKKSDRKGGLKSESLVEDETKDSPSGYEMNETPFRNTAKEIRGKTKPRSLTYEPEEMQKRRQRNLLPAEVTALPGPSGVKFRKKKADESPSVNAQLESSLENTAWESPQDAEKSKRKRKAAETRKEESPKKSVTEMETRMTRGRRK